MKLMPVLGLCAVMASAAVFAANTATPAAPAAPTAAASAKTSKSECAREADAQTLKGKARKEFMKSCEGRHK